MALARNQGLSDAGKGKLGLVLCCHVSPVPSVIYSTVLCTDSVTQADKGMPSGSPCPTHCTTGNYHRHHPISGVFKWGKLICRLGAVPVTTLCIHPFSTLINTNGHICMSVRTAHTRLGADTIVRQTRKRGISDGCTHAHTQTHSDTSRLGCRGRPAALFINICHHTGGSTLLSRASPALWKLFIKLTLLLPLRPPLFFCRFLLNITGIPI